MAVELLSDDVSDEELLSVPLVLVLSVHELPDGELGKDTEPKPERNLANSLL